MAEAVAPAPPVFRVEGMSRRALRREHPEVYAALEEVRKLSELLDPVKLNRASSRRVELVATLVERGLPVTAIARWAGVSSAALHKSKRRHTPQAENSAPGL